ncbi:MAG: LamG domain-containing protein, partial [Candidatus Woesearchaeota archaeon]
YCTDTTNTCTPTTTYTTPVQINTEGISYIRYRSTDNAGNTETTRSRTIKIDTTPPTTSISNITKSDSSSYIIDTWTSLNVSVNGFNCTDALSGCLATHACGDWTNSCTPSSLSTPILFQCAAGSVCVGYVRYNSTDNAFNVETTKSSTIYIDAQAPTTTINPNGQACNNSNVSVTLSCSDGSGSGCSSTWYKIVDSGTACDISGMSLYSSQFLVGCPPGSYCAKKICTYSIDNVSNAESLKSSNIYYIDFAGPNAPTGLLPSSGNCNGSSTPTLSWSAPSDVGCSSVAGYQVEIYSTSDCSGTALQTGTPSSNSWTPSALSTGTYSWRVKAKDVYNNWGSWSSCSVLSIDVSPPTPNPATISSIIPISSSQINITATTATDTGCSATVYYQINRTSPTTASSGWQTSPTWADTGLNCNTQYCYTAQTRDSLNNIGTASATSCTYTLVNGPSAPTVTPTSTTSLNVSWTAVCAYNNPQYYANETSYNTGATDSGWTTAMSYIDSGLNCFSQYTYRVKARNNQSVETAYSSTTSRYPIEYVSTCAGTGPSGKCWTLTTCYYTGTGCPSSTTMCASPNTYCKGADSSTCNSGNIDTCCYNVACTSGGASGSTSTVVNTTLCTCAGGNCNSGFCYNSTSQTCYTGVSCTATGWTSTSTNAPPNTPESPSATPSCAGPNTIVNATATITDPNADAMKLQVCKDSACTQTLCNSTQVSSGSQASCQFVASTACTVTGTCTIYLRALENSADACGQIKTSAVINTTFTYDANAPFTNATAITNSSTIYTFNTWTKSLYVNVTLNCTDSGGGTCALTQYCTDTTNTCTPTTTYTAPVQINTEGISYIRYNSTDNAGNTETTQSKTIKIDTTPPIYVGYSGISGYAYAESSTVYWVKGGNTFKIRISHSDSGSGVYRQYLGFNKDDCSPNGCGGAPYEIKSHSIYGSSVIDWMANDSYIDINGVSCVDGDGSCSDDDMTLEWSAYVNTTCSDWDYKLHTFLYDAVGNGVGYTDLGVWVKVDNTPPTVGNPTLYSGTRTGDTSGSYFKGTISVRSTISDSRSGLASGTCQVSINGGAWTSSGVTQDANYCYYNNYAPGATFTIAFRVNDNVGTTGTSSTSTFNYDATPPILTFYYPTPANNTYTPNNYTQINITIVESGAGLDSFKFNWNGTNYTFYDDSLVLALNFNNNSAIGDSATTAVDISKYGNNGTIYGATWTTAGKYGSALTFDGSTNYIEVPDSISLRVGDPEFTFEAWINPVSLSYCGTGIGAGCIIFNKEGSYEWGINSSGNLWWAIMNTNPGWNWQDSGLYVSTNTWTYLALVYDGNKVLAYKNGIAGNNITATGYVDNTNYINALRIGARGAPGAANSFFSGSIDEVRIYKRALSPQEILMHYQSEFAKYSSTEWRFYNNITNLTDGTYSYYGWANDSVANAGQSETRIITIDTTPPTTTATAVNSTGASYTFNTWTKSPYVNVTLTCNDASGSGCSLTQYCTDTTNTCTPTTTYTTPIQINTEGISYIRYRSTDNAGNTETTQSRTIKIDYSIPYCVITEISKTSDYAYVVGNTTYYSPAGSGSINISVSAGDSNGIAAVNFPQLSTIAGYGNDTSSPYASQDVGAYNFSTSSTFNGSGTITCYDNAGNTNTTQFTLVRDVTAPQIVLNSPAAGSWKNSNFQINISDSDSVSGLKACYYRVLSNGTQTKGWTVRNCNDVLGISVGLGMDCNVEMQYGCVVELRAYDNVNNSNTISVNFSIDWTPPSIPQNLTDSIEGWSFVSNRTFNWSASYDDVSGVAGYYYAIDDSAPEVGGRNTTSLYYMNETLPSGNHTFYVKAFDNAGNIGGYASHEFLVLSSKGIISTIPGTIPFWTNTSNPLLSSDLSCLGSIYDQQSCNVTWYVNATGTKGSKYEFFVIFESLNYSQTGYNQTLPTYIEIRSNNTPPSKVNLTSPLNNSGTEHDRNMTFVWNAAIDPESDKITYSLVVDDNADFSSPLIITDTNLTSYTYPGQLNLSTSYFWKVRAFDSFDYGEWSDTWNFSIEPYRDIEIYVANVSFGNLNPGAIEDTLDNSPQPIKIRNNGNIPVNISINSTALWSSVPLNTSYYQFRIGNISGEYYAFDWRNSRTSWTNMTNISTLSIIDLGYLDYADEARIDIRVEVPSAEPPATKNATIYIMAS